jgi:hypothetical protein
MAEDPKCWHEQGRGLDTGHRQSKLASEVVLDRGGYRPTMLLMAACT